MNIYASVGDRVIFARPNAGYQHDQESAAKHLKVGAKYTVDRTDVGGWRTDVYLQEVPGIPFNSVHFEDA